MIKYFINHVQKCLTCFSFFNNVNNVTNFKFINGVQLIVLKMLINSISVYFLKSFFKLWTHLSVNCVTNTTINSNFEI